MKLRLVEFKETLFEITVETKVNPAVYWGNKVLYTKILLAEEDVERFLAGKIVYAVDTDFAYSLEPGERIVEYKKIENIRRTHVFTWEDNDALRYEEFEYFKGMMQE